MSVRDFTVSVTPQDAMDAIETYVVEGNVSGTLQILEELRKAT